MRLHIDDLSRHVGKSLGTGEWTEVTQARVSTFTDAADDHQWIHTDAERAKTGPFGGPIAHGFLTLSLFIPMFEALLDLDGVTTKINYGLNRVRFPGARPRGLPDPPHRHAQRVEPVAGDGVQIVVDGMIDVEDHHKPACILQSVSRLYR